MKGTIHKIYKSLRRTENIMKENMNDLEYSREIEIIESKISLQHSDSRFFSTEIKNYIIREAKTVTHYHLHHEKVDVLFHIYNFKKGEHLGKDMIEYMCKVFIFLKMFTTRECSTKINVYLYPTRIRKTLPSGNEVLDTEHINNAFSYCCSKGTSELVIFREEDWKKVYIHEMFHNLGIDFCNFKFDRVQESIQKEFPIENEILLFEAYSEFWATYLYTCFHSYSHNKSFKMYSVDVKSKFSHEITFSFTQMIKILRTMNLSYEDLYNHEYMNTKNVHFVYKENTNVFAYNVLKCIMMFFHNDFLEWCNTNNTTLLQSSRYKKYQLSLLEWLKRHNKDKKLMKFIENITNNVYLRINDKKFKKSLMNCFYQH